MGRISKSNEFHATLQCTSHAIMQNEMQSCSSSGLPLTPSTSQDYDSCPYVASFLFPVLHPSVHGIPSAGALKTPVFPKASSALMCTAHFALWQQAAAADEAESQERPPHLVHFDHAVFPHLLCQTQLVLSAGLQSAASCTWPSTVQGSAQGRGLTARQSLLVGRSWMSLFDGLLL